MLVTGEWTCTRPSASDRRYGGVPLGRMAELRDPARVAAWLLSDRASVVTGAIVPVDGGADA
ncbi:SDR family oxidoreductase [Kitasatospora sp. NBC_01302]|nr:SDR family oxidoreductase [Kitasatospora sp. NBC_01302]